MNKLLSELFDDNGWVKYSKKIAQNYGVNASVLFGYLISQEIYWNKNLQSFREQTGYDYTGQFFQSRGQIQAQIFLTPTEQRTAEKRLTNSQRLPLISVVIKPIKIGEKQGKINYYSIIEENLIKLFNTDESIDWSLRKLTTGHKEIERPVVKKVDGNKTIYNKTIYNNTTRGVVVEDIKKESTVGYVGAGLKPSEEGRASASNMRTACASSSTNINDRGYGPLYTQELEAVQNLVKEAWKNTSFPSARGCDYNKLFHSNNLEGLKALYKNLPLLKYYQDDWWMQSNKNLSAILYRLDEFNEFCKDFPYIDYLWDRFSRENKIPENDGTFESVSKYKEHILNLYLKEAV